MSFTPNRIVLISRGRHEEAVADAPCYPGMLLSFNPSGNCVPNVNYGGSGPVNVAVEDALRGADVTQVLPAGNVVPYQIAAKGDELLFLLQNGQNVAAQVPLYSGGDGTLIADPASPLYEITAPSAVVTNTTSTTQFSNGGYAVPANTLLEAGMVLRINGSINVISQNPPNTHDFIVNIGSTSLDFGALALATGNVANFDLNVTLTVGGSASGSFTGVGTYWYGDPTNPTEVAWTLGSTTVDTTGAVSVTVTTKANVANVANKVQLAEFSVSLVRPGAFDPIVVSKEAINNSAGTGTSGFNRAAFVRGIVI
jgi:hypothetical protein